MSRAATAAVAIALASLGCGGVTDPGVDKPGSLCESVEAYSVESSNPCDPVAVPGLCLQGLDPPSSGVYLVCLVAPSGTLWIASLRGDEDVTTSGWTHSAYANAAKPSTLSSADETRCSQALSQHGSAYAFCGDGGTVDAGASWTSFTISQGAGPCPSDEICSWQWTLTPDRNLVMDKQGVVSDAVMLQADFDAAVHTIASATFLAQMQSGFACSPPPTDVSEAFSLTVAGSILTQDVTGCIHTNPDLLGPISLHNLVTKY